MDSKQYKEEAIRLIEEALPLNLKKLECTINQINLFRNLPKKLYKYCPITDYSLENLEKERLYIAPIDKMDDQFEAQLSSHNNFDDYYKDALEMLYDKFPETKQEAKNFGEDKLLDFYHGKSIEENIKGRKDLEQLPKIISQINSNNKFESTTLNFYNQIVETINKYGFCSLSEINNSQIMWQMYANNYSGVCIEYDIERCVDNILKSKLFPVTYVDNRNNDPIKIYLNIIYSCMAQQNQKEIQENLNEWMIDLFTTKNDEWKLQKEWRVIDESNKLVKAPPITSLFLGNNIIQNNKIKILEIAKAKNINVYEVIKDYEKLKIAFKKLF